MMESTQNDDDTAAPSTAPRMNFGMSPDSTISEYTLSNPQSFSFDLAQCINDIDHCCDIELLKFQRDILTHLTDGIVTYVQSNPLEIAYCMKLHQEVSTALGRMNSRISGLAFVPELGSDSMETAPACNEAAQEEFTLVKGARSARKRTLSSSSQPSGSGISLENKYMCLRSEEPPSISIENAQNIEGSEVDLESGPQKTKKGPPIFLANAKNVKSTLKKLTEVAGSVITGVFQGTDLKIVPPSPDAHRAIISYLEKNKIQNHSYPLKEDRQLKVVIKGLGHDFDLKELQDELVAENLPVLYVQNMPGPSVRESPSAAPKKSKLPIYIVALKNNADGKKIHLIRHIAYIKVRIEPLRRKHGHNQCYRCQIWGHSSLLCTREPVCLKCAESHLTKNCRKPPTEPAKCANCKGDHPANYSGCAKHPLNLPNPQPPKTNIWEERRKSAQNVTSPPEKEQVSFLENSAFPPLIPENLPSPSAQEKPDTKQNKAAGANPFFEMLGLPNLLLIWKNFLGRWKKSSSVMEKIASLAGAVSQLLEMFE